jgi:hypothetical protein
MMIRHHVASSFTIAFYAGEATDCKSYGIQINLPERSPDVLLADKTCDRDAIRADLKEHGIKTGHRADIKRTATMRYSKRLYRQRIGIERVLGHLKINRAVAARYDQLAGSLLGMPFLESANYWINLSDRNSLMRS